ncbi:MAG: hypothetical protein ACAI34_25895 [Verrucomicrobium sp.]|nr:hypothetical protein [Verrucomicrobium sp.]
MTTSFQVQEFHRSLLRSEGYSELGMVQRAEQELMQVPQDLQSSLPFLVAELKFFIHARLWDAAADAGLVILDLWPDEWEVRGLTCVCLLKAGREEEAGLQMLTEHHGH